VRIEIAADCRQDLVQFLRERCSLILMGLRRAQAQRTSGAAFWIEQ